MRSLFRFPDPVNEVSARLVAGGVLLMAIAALLTGQWWLLIPLAYGFVARVLTGPILSPLGQLVTRVITPGLDLPARPVPGPPKRFAQGIGAVLTSTALVLQFGFHLTGAAQILLGLLIVAAGLESLLAICLGCHLFAMLMRAGVIPDEVCEACADRGSRSEVTTPSVAMAQRMARVGTGDLTDSSAVRDPYGANNG